MHRQHAVVETDGVRTAKAMGLRGLPSKTWQVNCGWVIAANIAADLTAVPARSARLPEVSIRRVSAGLSANPAALAAQQSRLRPHRTVGRTVCFNVSRKRHKDLLDPYI